MDTGRFRVLGTAAVGFTTIVVSSLQALNNVASFDLHDKPSTLPFAGIIIGGLLLGIAFVLKKTLR